MKNKKFYILIALLLIIIISSNIVGCSKIKTSKDLAYGLIAYILIGYTVTERILDAHGKSDQELDRINDYRDMYGDDYEPALIGDMMRENISDRGLEIILGTSKTDTTVSTVASLGLPSDDITTTDEDSKIIPEEVPDEAAEVPSDPPVIPSENDGPISDDITSVPSDPNKQPGGDQDQEHQPENIPENDDDSYPAGEQEQPSGEFDVFTYYEPDIVEGENIQSITITVNIETQEVYGNHYFEGYIGGGYRTADYAFSTYLDSSDSFSVISTAIIYEDGQNIGEGTLKITGQLSGDMSYVYGQIIDEAVGYGVEYYAGLVTQSNEDPQTEDFLY